MKTKRAIRLLCIILSICLLLGGCGKTINPSASDNSETTEDQENNPPSQPVKQLFGGSEEEYYTNMNFILTENNFLDFYHYRIESKDQGGEYDLLTYEVLFDTYTDDISPYIEGISFSILFDVKIKYVKEYTENGLLYDTLTYTFRVSGEEKDLRGTVDISQIPVFKRNDTDTNHKKFTVLNITPHIESVSGRISYGSTNHTYKEAVTYDTAPEFEIAANDDCIAVYMIPQNNNFLYDGLAVEIELWYTSDIERPDPFTSYKGGRFTIEGNSGGYGQLLFPLDSIDGKAAKVVVSVVGISGSVIQSKGYTVFNCAN